MSTDYFEDYDYCDDDEPLQCCPKCDRWYDDIDSDFQTCSKCGWDANENRYEKSARREPNEDDYMSGEADILTGFWY